MAYALATLKPYHVFHGYQGDLDFLTEALANLRISVPKEEALQALAMDKYNILEVTCNAPFYVKFLAEEQTQPYVLIVAKENCNEKIIAVESHMKKLAFSWLIQECVTCVIGNSERNILVIRYVPDLSIPSQVNIEPIKPDLRDVALKKMRINSWPNGFGVLKALTIKGKYQLLHLDPDFVLGAGSEGVVLKVRDVASNLFCAMKVRKPGLVPGTEAADIQKANEIAPECSIRLVSSHSVELNEPRARTVVVTQYGGKTLHQRYIKEKPIITLSRWVGVLDKFGKYYGRLYRKFEHGDIKPSNIVINDEDEILFIDYGNWCQWNTPLDTFYKHSRWYRTPDVILPETTGSATSFGLGCVLAELLTGTPLFHTSVDDKASAEQDTNIHLEHVFSFIPPTDEFINRINPKCKEKFIPKSLHKNHPVEANLRQNLKKAFETNRVCLDSSIPPEEFIDLFVPFLKLMLSYGTPPKPEDLENHPFVARCKEASINELA